MKSLIEFSTQFLLLSLSICIALTECKVSPELQVVLQHGGGVTGKYMTSNEGRGIRAFLGIPFAEPPLGQLRFKSPVPKIPWTGFIAANVDNKVCPQEFGIAENAIMVGDEDCLYLNVCAPLNPPTNKTLPVMVFIHGGAFSMGSCGGPLYTPEYFLDHDVILVSGNYRLGALGFLSLNQDDFRGNMGLKDQLLVLEWVQDNIAAFGGDRHKVTIFGESAGSASVGHHLVSQLSEGKFHRAILQSGTQYAPWAFDFHGNNFKNAIALGNQLNCSLSENQESFDPFMACMRGKSAKEIISASGKIIDIFANAYNPFLPTTENGDEAMITQNPMKVNWSRGFNIPIMIGSTAQEGILKTALAYSSDEGWQKLNKYMDKHIYDLYPDGDPAVEQVELRRKLIKDFYFLNEYFDRKNVHNVTDYFSDAYFISPMVDFLTNRINGRELEVDTFVYLFAHRGAASLTDLFPMMLGVPDIDVNLGVSHMDDLFYLFPIGKNMLSSIVPTQLDNHIQRIMTKMWVNFATTGKPTDTESPVDWKPSTGFQLNYLRIGNYGEPEKELLKMERGFLKDRVELWWKLKSIFDPRTIRRHKEDL